MKPIILRQHEVIHLRDTGSVIAWRVVKPKKPISIGDKWWKASDVIDESGRCPYGRTGEERWVRETWNVTPLSQLAPGEVAGKPLASCIADNNGFAVPAFDGGVVYASEGVLSHPKFGRASWRSSSQMPRWASRFTVTLDVGVKRIQEVTGDEAVSSGIERIEVGTRFETWKNYEFKTAHPKHGSVITDIEHRISGFSSPIRCLQSLANLGSPGARDRNDYFWKITCTLKKP